MSHEATGPYHLGVDLGTTFTAAAACSAGQIDVVDLGNRATSMPSVVFLGDDGQFAVGESAERRAHTDPGRVAREFKRRLGDPTPIVLGGSPCSADLLTGELLRAAVTTAAERRGGSAGIVALTHPAAWGPYKLDLLRQAGRIAECGDVVLVSEPEAAVVHYSSTERVEPGAIVAVYDFGGGTFDAAVVRKTVDGVEILGTPIGVEQLGGVDFDQDVLRHVLGEAGDAVHSLDHTDPLVQAALIRLREECRDAKEGLSMVDSAAVPVMLPGVQATADLDRAAFEAMIRPAVERTIATLRDALASADVAPADLQAVLLAGGSSRVPLVQQMVSEEIGRPVALDAHPKYIVAMGAARAAATAAGEQQPEQPVQIEPPVIAVAPRQDSVDDPPTSAPADDLGGVGAPYETARDLDDDAVSAPPGVAGWGDQREPTSGPAAAATRQHTPAAPATADPPAATALPPRTPPPQQLERQVPWVLIVFGVLLFAGIVGGFVFLGGGDDPAEGEPESEVAGPGGEPDEPDPTTEPGPTETPVPSPTPDPTATETPAPVDPAVARSITVGAEPDTPVEADGLLWVPNAGDETMTRIDPVTGDTEAVTVGAAPDAALFAAGAIWVPARDGGVLTRIDPATSETTTIDVGPDADTPTLAGGFIWVAVRGTSELLLLDPGDGSVLQRLTLGGRPLTPVVDGDSLWFVTRDDNALHVIDLTTVDPDQPISFDSIAVGTDPQRPLAAGGRIWVAARDDSRVNVVDATTRAIIDSVDVGDTPDTPVAANGRIWVPNSRSTTVTVIDADDLSIVADLEVGSRPRTGIATEDHVWIPVGDDNVVVRLDAAEAVVVDEFLTGAEPDTPALIGDSVWVPNAGSGTLTEITLG